MQYHNRKNMEIGVIQVLAKLQFYKGIELIKILDFKNAIEEFTTLLGILSE